MFSFKLQLGCMIVVLYITVSYVKSTLEKKVPCNKYFDLLLTIAPWTIFFDGATAYTVNRLYSVSPRVNMLLHGLFFVSINAVVALTFAYMIQQTVGIRSHKERIRVFLPGIITQLGILCTIKELYYVEGKTTNYSYGQPVFICFFSLFMHIAMILLLLCLKHRTIEKRKMAGISIFMFLILGLLLSQILLPEVLLSSLVPMLAVLGIYMNSEDPSLKRLHSYNDIMVTGFATLVENRDDNTGGHIRRTKGYVQIILEEMQRRPEYTKFITRDYMQNVIDAAPMHDIGKIATPDHILQKAGKLDEEEYAIMKQHAAIGGDIIRETFKGLDHPEFLQIAYEVARYHHEKWNGRGYPDGKKGEEIPLHARIMAIADVFDAVSSKRCYRDAMPIEQCFRIIEDGAGSDFDPKLVEIFMNAGESILRQYRQDQK